MTRPWRARRLFALTFLLVLKLQARTHEAKVVALSSVVEGKGAESEAMLLRRQLEGERLMSSLLGAPCPSHDSSGSVGLSRMGHLQSCDPSGVNAKKTEF